jgi:hypothetical protein
MESAANGPATINRRIGAGGRNGRSHPGRAMLCGPNNNPEAHRGSRRIYSVRWAARESWGLKSPRRSDEERCIRRRG